MKRGPLLWLAVFATLAVIVAAEVVAAAGRSDPVAGADVPKVTPGTDVLAGVVVVPARVRGRGARGGGLVAPDDRVELVGKGFLLTR